MLMHRRDILTACAALTGIAITPGASAQHPVLEQAKLLVGFPPGGGTDASARRLAEGLRGLYARTVLVDNKPGAAGRLVVDEMRRGPPDGSLMVVAPEAVVTQQPLVDPKNTHYGFDDLAPVAAIGAIQHAFAVGPLVPESVRSMKDFFSWARANPLKANFGTPGTNSAQDLLMRSIGTGVTGQLTHAPYRGSAPGVQDLLAGQIAAFLSPVGDSLPHAGTGRMRLLGTSGELRSRFAPEVPTFVEQGLRDMVLIEYFGVWMARGVPDAVRRHAAAAVRSVVAQPATAESLARFGIEVATLGEQEFADAVRASHGRWAERLQRMGFRPDS